MFTGNRCHWCPSTYIWPADLKRHIRHKHGGFSYDSSLQESHPPPGSNEEQRQSSDPPCRLKHPFSAFVCGPTFSGKTYFVTRLLQNNRNLIDPPPQRIVWLYKRWQALYDLIKMTVRPPVEFMSGIPLNLEKDRFIDPSVRNLIVLDDLMSEASKDPRITGLFTEGSHHRNLSVIALNQNLYYNKDPTQRRNCQYLILFSSPIDQQQIATLGRQMYPDNAGHFMRYYQEATSRPYGYLLVDLKPYTPEALRLRGNALEFEETKGEVTQSKPPQEEVIRGGGPLLQETREPLEKSSEVTKPTMETPKESFDIPKEDWPSCTFCGLLFASERDLVRHLRREHPDSDSEEALCFPSRKRRHREDDGPATKKVKLDQVKELPPFWVAPVHYRLRREFGDEMDQGQEDYEKKGYDEDLALRKAINDMLPALRKRARQIVSETLVLLENINNDPIYASIMPTARRLQKKGSMNGETAIRAAVRLFKDELNPLLVHKRDESETEEEEEEEEGEEGEDEKSQ